MLQLYHRLEYNLSYHLMWLLYFHLQFGIFLHWLLELPVGFVMVVLEGFAMDSYIDMWMETGCNNDGVVCCCCWLWLWLSDEADSSDDEVTIPFPVHPNVIWIFCAPWINCVAWVEITWPTRNSAWICLINTVSWIQVPLLILFCARWYTAWSDPITNTLI